MSGAESFPDPAVHAYVDALDPDGRALFDRFSALVRAEHPDAAVTWAYKMPTFVVDGQGLHVGVWKHGLSLYGWSPERSGGFCDRYPQLCGDRGTLKLPHRDMAEIPDVHLRELIRAVLAP